MPHAPDTLRPADPDDLLFTLSFALRYRGRKRVDTAGDAMARITAERLVEHLAASGFVVMKKPPAQMHSGPRSDMTAGPTGKAGG